MPTAKSAATCQPNTRAFLRRLHPRISSGLRRLTVSGLGLVVGLAVVMPAETIDARSVATAAGPGTCSGWSSTTRPPDYIRVLRRQTGRVVRVPFRRYVLTVMGKEWPGYLPQQVINAGAVAVKQYAWYHALGKGRVSSRGQCFDVTDGVGDQLYKPGRARIRSDHYAALAATWNVRLLKGGQLFMTGYRTGSKHGCGRDATGWKLYARSAVRCARRGMGYLQILRTYYGPVSVQNSGGNGGGGGGGTPGDSAQSINSTAPAPQPTPPTQPTSETPELTATGATSGGVGVEVDVPPATAAPIGERAFSAA